MIIKPEILWFCTLFYPMIGALMMVVCYIFQPDSKKEDKVVENEEYVYPRDRIY